MATFAMRPDMRKEGPDAVQHPHEVDVEHPSPGVERDVVDAAAASDSGIVADDVDVAERLMTLRGGTLDAGGVGDVADDAAHVRPDVAQGLHGGGQRIGLDVGEHHPHARAREGVPSARPMPLAPPVTKAVLPARSRMALP